MYIRAVFFGPTVSLGMMPVGRHFAPLQINGNNRSDCVITNDGSMAPPFLYNYIILSRGDCRYICFRIITITFEIIILVL